MTQQQFIDFQSARLNPLVGFMTLLACEQPIYFHVYSNNFISMCNLKKIITINISLNTQFLYYIQFRIYKF